MATVTLQLVPYNKKQDGTFPVKFKISFGDGRAFYVPTGISIPEERWNGTRVSGWNAGPLNTKIAHLRNKISMALEKCDGRLKGLSVKEAHKVFDYYFDGAGSYSSNEFVRFFTRVMNDRSKKKTMLLYRTALDKCVEFSNGAPLGFDTVNYSWLVRFQSWMTQCGLSANTQVVYFQCIRKVFNEAINEDIISMDTYPFRKFKFHKERTRKRSLTIDQLRRLRDYPCLPQYDEYRDMFMLIFYLGGINMIDLAHATNITEDGYLDYRREKTGEYCRVKVEPEAMAIIKRYRGKKYVLNIMERYQAHATYLGRMNKALKKIGKVEVVPDIEGKMRKFKHTPIFPDLSSYWARHTVATIAVQLNIHEKVIGKILGHADNSINGWYEQVYQQQADDAMRQIIDAIAGPEGSGK